MKRAMIKIKCLLLGHDKAYAFSMKEGITGLKCLRCGRPFKS